MTSLRGITGTTGDTGTPDLAPLKRVPFAEGHGHQAGDHAPAARRRRRPGREEWAVVMDGLLAAASPSPSAAMYAAAAAELGITERVVRDRFVEARRIAYRRLGVIELSPSDLAAPSVTEAAARTGRPAWAVRMALERTPGRAPLRLLADEPYPATTGAPASPEGRHSHA